MTTLKDNLWVVMIFVILSVLNILVLRSIKTIHKDIAAIKYVTTEHQKALIDHATVIRSLLPKEVQK